jgi:hypothetical protein
MNKKKIILGNNDGIILDNNIKYKIIDYLYEKIDLQNYRYIILNKIETLKFLQDNEHYISPNFKGYNYLLIMITINNIQYSVVIDRRKLSYHKNQLDIKNIQIIQIQIKTSESIYRGTIFDGKLIQKNNEYIFLIQDCFYMMGNKIFEMEISQKFIHLDSILKNHFKKEDNKNYCINFEFKLNKLYKYENLNELIYEIIPKLTIPLNGIIFYPNFSGINILHIEKKIEKIEINSTNNNDIIINKTFNIIDNYVNYLKNRTYSYEQNNKNKILWLTKTNIPDVYTLSEKDNNEKIGIALIPSLKISHMCDELIANKAVKFNCIFSSKFKKWIPLYMIK